MSQTAPPGLDPDLYVSLTPRGGVILACLIGGAIGVVVIALQFVAVILSAPVKTNPDSIPYSSGLVGGISAATGLALINAFRLMRHTRMARLSPHGLLIEMYLGSRFVPWTSIATLRRDKKSELGSEAPRQTLTILDERGKRLGEITSDLVRFDELVARIESGAAEVRGQPVMDADADRARRLLVQRRKARRNGIFAAIFTLMGVCAIAGGSFIAFENHQLRAHGIETDAQIDKLYMRAVTPWIDVSFDDATGRRFAHSGTLTPEKWDALQGHRTARIRYVPTNPRWALLADEKDEDPSWLLIACGAGLVLLFGGVLVMLSAGYADLKISDGKFRLVKIGEDELDEVVKREKGF
jgi:hypothetical protein